MLFGKIELICRDSESLVRHNSQSTRHTGRVRQFVASSQIDNCVMSNRNKSTQRIDYCDLYFDWQVRMKLISWQTFVNSLTHIQIRGWNAAKTGLETADYFVCVVHSRECQFRPLHPADCQLESRDIMRLIECIGCSNERVTRTDFVNSWLFITLNITHTFGLCVRAH